MGAAGTPLRAPGPPRRRAGALIDAVGDAIGVAIDRATGRIDMRARRRPGALVDPIGDAVPVGIDGAAFRVHSSPRGRRSEEHTSELQSQSNLVCRLLLETKNRLCA